MSLFEKEYDPYLEQYIEFLYEEAKDQVKESFVSHVIGRIRGIINIYRYNVGIKPNFSIDVAQIDNEEQFGVEIKISIHIPAQAFQKVKERIRSEVYARGRDAKLKMSVLRKIVFNELRASTYGIQDLLGSAGSASQETGGGRAEVRNKEGGSDNQNVDEDLGGGDTDLDREEVQ